MKKILALSFLFITAVFPLVLKAQMTAVEYNDYIINEQNKIGTKLIAFTTALDASDFPLAETNLKTLKEQADEALKNMTDLGAYPGHEGFYEASLNLFRFYKSVINYEYIEIFNILKNENVQTEDYDRLTTLVTSVTEREKPVDESFRVAQQKFADDNNFELVENELQQQIDQ